MLSAVIITRDEADRIGVALASVAFADEVLILDCGSTDATVAVARAAGARVVETDWPGHVAQKNRGLAMASGEWVLSIDADEEVSPALRASILEAVARAGDAVGFRVNRRNEWLGHTLRHGGWYPDARVRLVRRGRATWAGENPHDTLVPDGPVLPLDGDLLHRPYRSFGEHLATLDRYTTIAAAEARARGRGGSVLDLLIRPPWAFFRGYVLRAGFLDGAPGLVVAALGALYVLVKWARIWAVLS